MRDSSLLFGFLKGLSFLILGASIHGCSLSFHSTQYQFLKSLMSNTASPDIPTWILKWNGDERVIFPISLEAETVFTDGDSLFVRFDGWNVTMIRGLDDLGVLERVVQSDEAKINSFENSSSQDKILVDELLPIVWNSSLGKKWVWYCDGWSNRSDGYIGYVQPCFVEDLENGGVLEFLNTIELNSSGMIQSISSTFAPEEGELRMELK